MKRKSFRKNITFDEICILHHLALQKYNQLQDLSNPYRTKLASILNKFEIYFIEQNEQDQDRNLKNENSTIKNA